MNEKTTTEKVLYILTYSVINTKKDLAEELGITRPTLDSRMSGKSEWKKLEIKWINHIYFEMTKSK